MIRLLIALLLLPSMAAAAIPDCVQYSEVETRLFRDYQEEPDQFGITGVGPLVELFTAEGGATWTLIVVYPDGCVDLLAAGEYWMKIVHKDEEL